MHHTGFSKRIHRSIQLISVSVSAVLIKLIPNWLMLLWISVQTCQEEEERATVQSHSSLSKDYFSNCQCEAEGSSTQLRQRERVEQWTLNCKSTLTCCRKKCYHGMMRIRGGLINNLCNINLSKSHWQVSAVVTKGTKFPNQYTSVIYCIRLPLPSVKHSSWKKYRKISKIIFHYFIFS